MIYWAPFLHFYQPPTQFHAILKKICNESYRPLVKMLLEHPGAKVTINMCAVLTESLNDHGAADILSGIKQLAHNGQLEFVESGKYHPILPLLPPKEMRRQIRLNKRTNEYFFGDDYNPKGFFPPEMCYSQEVGRMVRSLGYSWILLGGIACADEWPLNFISQISVGSQSISIFYRDDILSNKISFHNLDAAGFIKELVGLSHGKKDIYVVTAMDAETFGHHIHHWEELFLQEVYETIDNITSIHKKRDLKQKTDLADAHKKIFAELKELPHIEAVTISELMEKFSSRKTKVPRPSSWSTSKDEIAKKNFYPLWKDPQNRIHELQWEHIYLCLELVEQAMNIKDNTEEGRHFAIIARGLLDRAIHSCQMWWANKATGRWDINMINKGLIMQEEVALNAYKSISLSPAKDTIKKKLYHKVTAGRDISNKIRDLLIA